MKVLFTDHTTMLTHLDDLNKTGRGGMVTSLRILPDVLSKLNIACSVLSDIKHHCTTDCGVEWWTRDEWDIVAGQEWDFLIFNRSAQNGFPEIRAKRRILWTHDLPHGGWIPNRKTIRAFTATVFMSGYAERSWRYFYPDIGKSFTIPNGVDKTVFYPREKDLNYLIYASAPNRGAKRIGLFFESLKSKVNPSLRMKAFTDMSKLHPAESEECEGWEDVYSVHYKSIEESGIERPGVVPQSVLAEELGRAGMMLLPTGYPEICSNIVLQSLQSGTPVVTTGHLGSACEWVEHKKNGMVTRFHLEDYMAYHMEFYSLAKEILKNTKLHLKLIENGPKTKNLYTWEEIGRQWARMLKSLR